MAKIYEKVSATEVKITDTKAVESTLTIAHLLEVNKHLKARVDDLNKQITANLADIVEMEKLGLTKPEEV